IAAPWEPCGASSWATRAAGSSTTTNLGGDGGIVQGYETALESRQEIHAGEAGPVAVPGEQLVGLVRLDPAAPERRRELDQAEIARQPDVVAAEPLDAHDPDPPVPDHAC